MSKGSTSNGGQPSVAIESRNAAVVVTLQRPKALNALDGPMREAIASALPGCARDPIIYSLILRSDSPKAFCAGGDVRSIVETYKADPAAAGQLFAEEYKLNWALECFSKPSVSLMNGVVMGSGAGLSSYNTHRVGGEGYRFAMPETAIGLFPDVGVAHVLARMPSEIGTYLGLTGRAVSRADAFALGLLTHCVSADRFEEITEALSEAWPVDAVCDDRHEDPGPSELMAKAGVIAQCFSAPTVGGIIERLGSVAGEQAEWAAAVIDDLRNRAPLSLLVTLRHLREAADTSIRETLIRDYRLACRFLEGHDFAEGVRAMLIDKDKSPKWQHASILDVTPHEVDEYFAPLSGGDLDLPTREALQVRP